LCTIGPKSLTHAHEIAHEKKMTIAHAQFATLCRYDRFRNLKSGIL